MNHTSGLLDGVIAVDWSSLPGDILTAILAYLPQYDRGVARRVCRSWAQQALSDAVHVQKRTELTKQAATFFQKALPSLDSLSMVHARSLFHVHTLSQLTSLELLQPSYIPDFLPLTDLPKLRRLRLEGCELGRAPCFNHLTQLKEATVIGCQQGGHSESNAILTSLLSLPLDQLQFSQPLISQSLQPLLDMTANGHASTLRVLCLSVQFVRSFEHLVYLTSLKALVLAGAQPVKLQCLGALTQLEALSLAGLQKPPIYEANGEAELVAAVRKLKALRVLDVRHAHAPPHAAMLKLPSLCLLGLHDTAAESVVGKGAWKQHANVDMVAAAEAAGWPLAQSKRTRLCSVILHHAKRLGQDAVLDAQDESFIRIFDEFWRMHVMQAVFDAPNLEDQDDGDDWDDPFMEDDEEGYGYMDDAFNVMDELDDEAAMEFMDQPFYDDGMDVPFDDSAPGDMPALIP